MPGKLAWLAARLAAPRVLGAHVAVSWRRSFGYLGGGKRPSVQFRTQQFAPSCSSSSSGMLNHTEAKA
eukprot:15463749-Alexandrium_andersonii.AAC.1